MRLDQTLQRAGQVNSQPSGPHCATLVLAAMCLGITDLLWPEAHADGRATLRIVQREGVPMATWGLIRETANVKHWDSYITETHVLAYVEGTYEEALAELERHARRSMANHPKKRKRRRLFRSGDDFLMVVDDAAWRSSGTRYTVAELLEDTAAPAQPTNTCGATMKPTDRREATKPEPVDTMPPASPPEEQYPDGVPVKPKWLGRADLP
ncbi:hypothetical protein [Streptomyces bluensis]|uniref:hypothetical protein n=1 Tax=Streptomyces bluensis TaxID=33897 RepID=UPI00332A664C